MQTIILMHSQIIELHSCGPGLQTGRMHCYGHPAMRVIMVIMIKVIILLMMMMMSSTTKVKEMYHCIGCDWLLWKVTKRMESWLNEIYLECLVEELSKDSS